MIWLYCSKFSYKWRDKWETNCIWTSGIVYFYWQKNCLTLWNHFPDFTRTQLTRTQHGFTWMRTICVSRVFSVKAYAMWVFHVIIVSEFKARKNQILQNQFITCFNMQCKLLFNLNLIWWPLLNSKFEL